MLKGKLIQPNNINYSSVQVKRKFLTILLNGMMTHKETNQAE